MLEQARLSLLGRGLVSPDGTMSGLNALADLAVLLLDVRLGAQALVVVERWVAGQEHGPDLRMLHLIPEGGVVEDVHGLGLHGFDLQTDPEELVRDALVPLLPPDAVPGAGPTRRVDASDPAAIAAALGDPQVVAELTLADPSGQRRETWLVAVGRDGCFRSRRPDLGGEQQEGAPRSFEPISPQEIQECLSRWVGGVVDPVE